MNQTQWQIINQLVDDNRAPQRIVLANRGYEQPEQVACFLDISLDQLHDPYLLPDMECIIKRIKQAKQNAERVVIYGDYDVDGITSTALLYLAFQAYGILVDYYIPDRFEEGYGISDIGLKRIAEMGVQLVITVDCGITAIAAAELAKSLALDLVITDHHTPQSELPQCLALCNPKLAHSAYPYDMLAGAGIALKLAQALLGLEHPLIKRLLALSAIGTIADIAPLDGENRIIAKYGLQYLKSDGGVGVNALIAVSGLDDRELSAGHIGFSIGPRLNAAGRLESARKGVALLIGDDMTEAEQIAQTLDQLNQQRQQTEATILKQAIDKIEADSIHRQAGIIVVWGQGWHHGVVGIVASRLVDRYYMPTVVLSQDEDQLKGSARSVAGYSIFDALSSQKHLFTAFGGHQQAAGLSLPFDNLKVMITGLASYNQQHMDAHVLTRKLKIDSLMPSRQINHHNIAAIEAMKPFGVGNPTPTFYLDNLIVEEARLIGKTANHLKLMLNSRAKLLTCLQFGYGTGPIPKYHQRVDVAFQPGLNVFNGIESIQLIAQDIRTYHPYASEFNRYWYIEYGRALMCFIKQFDSATKLLSSHPRVYNESTKWLSNQQPLLISSYEGLLEVAYAAHDRQQDLAALLADDEPTIQLLPNEHSGGAWAIDMAFIDLPDMAIQLHNPTDHLAIQAEVADVFFNRQRFSDLYRAVKAAGQIDMHVLLADSQSILLDLVALYFFEEAGFIAIKKTQIVIQNGVHKHYEYNQSQIKAQFERLKHRLYQIAKHSQQFSKI